MAESDGAENFEIARVISRSFATMGANAPVYFGLALLIVGVPILLLGLLPFTGMDGGMAAVETGSMAPLQVLPIMAVMVLVMLIINALLQVTLTRATVASLSGDTPQFGDCLAVGLRLAFPTIAISVLVFLAILGIAIGLAIPLGFIVGALVVATGSPFLSVIAMLLVYVPIVMLLVTWSVTVPAYVAERQGIFASFGRSRSLTKGARWKIFAILLVVIVGTLVFYVLAGFFSAALMSMPLLGTIVSAVVASVSSVVMVTVVATSYIELRDVKEGVGATDLEAIFA